MHSVVRGDRRPRRDERRPLAHGVLAWRVMSVPHITSGASVVIVPSCAFGPCDPGLHPVRGLDDESCSPASAVA